MCSMWLRRSSRRPHRSRAPASDEQQLLEPREEPGGRARSRAPAPTVAGRGEHVLGCVGVDPPREPPPRAWRPPARVRAPPRCAWAFGHRRYASAAARIARESADPAASGEQPDPSSRSWWQADRPEAGEGLRAGQHPFGVVGAGARAPTRRQSAARACPRSCSHPGPTDVVDERRPAQLVTASSASPSSCAAAAASRATPRE